MAKGRKTNRRMLVLLIIVLFVAAFFLIQRLSRHTESVDVCETENPNFSPSEECQKIVSTKYSGKTCTFSLGPRKDLPLGSCTECRITCK